VRVVPPLASPATSPSANRPRALKAAGRGKERLPCDLSHELRNPLASPAPAFAIRQAGRGPSGRAAALERLERAARSTWAGMLAALLGASLLPRRVSIRPTRDSTCARWPSLPPRDRRPLLEGAAGRCPSRLPTRSGQRPTRPGLVTVANTCWSKRRQVSRSAGRLGPPSGVLPTGGQPRRAPRRARDAVSASTRSLSRLFRPSSSRTGLEPLACGLPRPVLSEGGCPTSNTAAPPRRTATGRARGDVSPSSCPCGRALRLGTERPQARPLGARASADRGDRLYGPPTA